MMDGTMSRSDNCRLNYGLNDFSHEKEPLLAGVTNEALTIRRRLKTYECEYRRPVVRYG